MPKPTVVGFLEQFPTQTIVVQADGSEEMEVDINELSTEVLWKLHHFTRSILQNIRKKPGQKQAEAPGGSAKPNAAPAAGDGAKQPNGSGGQAAQGSASSSSSGETLGDSYSALPTSGQAAVLIHAHL